MASAPRTTDHSPRITFLALAALALSALAGCERLPGKPRPEDRPIRPDQVEKFSDLFAANCAGCHGAAGTLGPAPPLNDPLFLKIVPDDELLMVVAGGRPGTLMPAFARSHPGGTLTPNQVIVLGEGLKKEWGKDPNIQAPLPSYSADDAKEKGAKAGDAAAGRKAFDTACAMCHGNEGQGTKAAGAINRPAFLTLISDQALRRLVITGRADLGMPNFAETIGRPEGFKPLTNQDVNDIVALLVSWRGKSLSTFK
jgi:mono/diheme cytochrome c family protein